MEEKHLIQDQNLYQEVYLQTLEQMLDQTLINNYIDSLAFKLSKIKINPINITLIVNTYKEVQTLILL